MPDNQFRAQRSPSPKASPKALPPLSKFFYGPAPGRGSAEASPASYTASTWTINSPQEQAPTLPPRHSPGPPPYSPTQWAKNFPSYSDPAQGWDEYVPAPSAPPAGQFIDSYALMHQASRTPVNPTWDSNSPRASMDASRWSVNYQPIEAQKPAPPAKPPLPPRISQNQDQMQQRSSENTRSSQNHPQSTYSSKQPPSSRVSATTIDVPLFLQPFAYDAETAPPLPRRPSNSPPRDQQSPIGSPNAVPQPQRLPPPPPKIPLDQDSTWQVTPPVPQRPQYDPRHSFDGSQNHMHSPWAGQRQPTYDPQDSHATEKQEQDRQQRHSSQPKIPTPRFSKFNEESALPPPSNESDAVPSHRPSSPKEQQQNKVDDRFRAGTRLHQSSISPINNNDNDRLVPDHNRFNPQATYVPSPEPQHAALAPRDGSITTTDASSNRAGLSTPESQQTSNTSSHESVTQPDHSRQERPGDETFYWHSGRSSSGAEEEYSQGGSTTATPGQSSAGKGSSIATTASTIRQETQSHPVRSSSKATTPNVIPYGASALGFGGPSDWEYFGDYEAEEVDDEELYARSKGPAELPVESINANNLVSAEEEEEEQPTFEIDPPPVPDRSPARESTSVFPPREETLERPKHATGDYTSTRLRMSSVQSPTRLNNSWNQDDRPISYYQRPDLDDVIRAWSEAPYIGVDHNKDAPSHAAGEDDEIEVDRVPEASLASTPQDRFLGIDLILKDAPEMPKLPDSIDQPSPSFPSPSFGQQKFDKIASSDTLKSDTTKPTVDSKKRFSKQLEPVIEREGADMEKNSASGQTSKRGSHSRFPDKIAPESSFKVEPKRISLGRLAEESNHEQQINLQTAAADVNNNVPERKELPHKDAASARPSKESSAPTGVKVAMENSQATQESKTKSSINEGEGQVVQINEQQKTETQSMAEVSRPQSQALHNANKEQSSAKMQFTHMERPLNIRKISKEDLHVPSGRLPSENLSVDVSRRASKDTFQDAASTLSSDPPSREDLKQSQNASWVIEEPLKAVSQGDLMASSQKEKLAGNDIVGTPVDVNSKVQSRPPAPIKVEAMGLGGRSLQHDDSKPAKSTEPTSGNSIPTSPKSPSSPKAIKVVDPYADLDPWGKASLNRFAAMLREEARVESNRDKLNIFNVFTSRESRLRVVLYGTDDELILPSGPTDVDEVEQEPSLPTAMDKKADEWQSENQPFVEKANVDQTSAEPEIVKLTADEQKAIEEKLAAQITAEEKHTVSQQPSVPQDQSKKSFVKQAIERANNAGTLKALPALPTNRDSVIGLPPSKLTPLITQDSATLKRQGTSSGNNLKSKVDSPSDEVQFSPGGRPLIPKLPQRPPETQELPISNDPKRGSRSIDGNSIEPENASTAEARPRPRPKTKDGESEVNNYLTNRRSVYRPFATQTLETMESGSNFGRQSDIKIDSTPIPLLRAPSSKFNATKQSAEQIENLPEVTPDITSQVPTTPEQSNQRRFVQADFDPLLMVLPEGEARVCESNRLQALKEIMEAVPEDFSFIHASVVAWDANTRVQREANDRLRHERQAESEKHIDSLFDDHEIGYGDISELEAEFKRSEAARKADEDRSEYQTFVSDVFDLVWTRLHYELDQLVPHYERYSVIMDETLAGKDVFTKAADGLALAPTMTQFLALHQKIEIRHQKAFEAVLERDRRLKKTEISPWYTLNNIPKVKQLEKQFEDAEKRAIIEYCEQRDGRANQLMDVLDQNTLRGVGANQDYMEAIMKAVRRIASGRAFDSVPGSDGASAGLKEVQKARTVTALLATSSEQIVQTFHVADMLLNSADYEVSVAKAKVARVDLATLAKLKEERAKEDQKLMRDLEHRLALIREDSRRTNDEIIKLMLFLGVQNGGADEAAPHALGTHMRGGSLEAAAALDMQAGPVNDPEHQERMRKALEEAKKRNARKEPV